MAAKPVVRPTPAAAFEVARRWVREGRRLDMVGVAGEVGVSRNTLYRWTGDRDRLLADVVWADLQRIVEHSWAHAEGEGRARLEDAGGRFLHLVADQSALRSLIANEGESGLRMLTSPRGPVRPLLIARVAELIEGEVARGAYAAPAPPAILADGIVSLGERFLHNGGDPELNPDPATARAIVSLLLRE